MGGRGSPQIITPLDLRKKKKKKKGNEKRWERRGEGQWLMRAWLWLLHKREKEPRCRTPIISFDKKYHRTRSQIISATDSYASRSSLGSRQIALCQAHPSDHKRFIYQVQPKGCYQRNLIYKHLTSCCSKMLWFMNSEILIVNYY
jgi:hypothetical protein